MSKSQGKPPKGFNYNIFKDYEEAQPLENDPIAEGIPGNTELVIPHPNDGFTFDKNSGTETICYFYDKKELDYTALKQWGQQTNLSQRGILPYTHKRWLKPNIIAFQHK